MTETLRGEHRDLAIVRYRLDRPTGSSPPGGWPFVLALHGRGEDGDIMAGRLSATEVAEHAWLCPTGPLPQASASGRREGGSWYAYNGDATAFVAALIEAEAILLDLVSSVADRHGLDPSRAVAAGFSQGGYLASFVALRHRRRFRGLVAISCRIKHEVLGAELAGASGYPVLGIHGADDRAVEAKPQQRAFEVLTDHGLDATLHLHPGGHRMRRRDVPLIRSFVDRVLHGTPPA